MSQDDFFEYLKDEIKDIKKTQIKVLTELATLKVKASFWGFISGTIPVIGALLIYIFKGVK